MTDVKDNSPSELDKALATLARKANSERQFLSNYEYRKLAKQAILEEMDRVVAEVIGDSETSYSDDGTSNDFVRGRNMLIDQQRNRWQEVRGKL